MKMSRTDQDGILKQWPEPLSTPGTHTQANAEEFVQLAIKSATQCDPHPTITFELAGNQKFEVIMMDHYAGGSLSEALADPAWRQDRNRVQRYALQLVLADWP